MLLLTSVSSSHAIDRAHYRELFQKLGALAKQKDWQGARDVLTEIGRELPAPTPRYFLTVASVEAHLGHKAEALQWLEKFAATGLTYDAARDDDLKALLAEEAGQKIAAQMKESSQPVAKAEFVCALAQADIMPEDIAYREVVRCEIRRPASSSPAFSSARSIAYRCPRREQRMRGAGAAARRRSQTLAHPGGLLPTQSERPCG